MCSGFLGIGFQTIISSMTIEKLPEDILLSIFAFTPNSMYLLNKKWTLEYAKWKYNDVEITVGNEDYYQYYMENNLQFKKLMMPFGTMFPYASLVRMISLNLDDIENSTVQWEKIHFPNVQGLSLLFPWYTCDDEVRLSEIVLKFLDPVKSFKHFYFFCFHNDFMPLPINNAVKQLKYLRKLKLKLLPVDLHEYASFSTISRLEADHFEADTEYLTMPHIKELKIDCITNEEVAKIAKIFPNLTFFECTFTFPADSENGYRRGLNISGLEKLPKSITKLKLVVDYVYRNRTEWKNQFQDLPKLKECAITLSSGFGISSMHRVDLFELKDIFGLLSSCPFRCVFNGDFSDIFISNYKLKGTFIEQKSKNGIYIAHSNPKFEEYVKLAYTALDQIKVL